MSSTTFTVIGLIPVVVTLFCVPMGLTTFVVALLGSAIALSMLWYFAVRLFTGEWPDEDEYPS